MVIDLYLVRIIFINLKTAINIYASTLHYRYTETSLFSKTTH